jgi:glutathione S-transferase
VTAEVWAFAYVPPFAQGYVRDLRIRWALEEAGIPYEARLVSAAEKSGPEYRRRQPFAQIPAYRDGEVEMFESGAAVLHIAERSEALAPKDAAGRARVTTWVLAALNSIEPHTMNLLQLGDSVGPDVRARLQAMFDERLTALAAWLGDKDYLEGRFTAGDLIMASVLREPDGDNLLAPFPTLAAYVKRCEARPAFARAMEAQMQPFREHALT